MRPSVENKTILECEKLQPKRTQNVEMQIEIIAHTHSYIGKQSRLIPSQ
jgi:hypothetical protein